jgi:putative SOS response-associated peptidase YedK
MCGRYVRKSDKQRISEHFRLGDAAAEVFPSYNVAPTTFQPVIRLDEETDERILVMMRWGLVPQWVSDAKKLGISTINAKAESILEKPIWRKALEKRRCLVPADAFYEWQKLDAKTKQPYAFALRSGEPFAFAGLWERRRSPDGAVLESYSIITTSANELTASVHERMPVILKPSDYQRWLAIDESSQLPVDLLRPFDADRMKSWQVHQDVGNARNNYAELCGDW